MGRPEFAVFILLALLFVWRKVYVKYGGMNFWMLASRYPNESYDWFNTRPEWIVVDSAERDKIDALRVLHGHMGPFRLHVPKLNNRLVLVFGREESFEESQEAFVQQYGDIAESSAERDWISKVALIYPIGSMLYHFAGTRAPFSMVLGYGLAQLGYLVLGGGMLAGHFRALGFTRRGLTLLAGVILTFVGVLLSNLDLLERRAAIAIIVIVAIVVIGIRFRRALPRGLPRFTREDIADPEWFDTFVKAFVNRDSLARGLLNSSNRALFAKGYRPTIGVPHDPEAGGRRYSDIQAYFTRKLFLDLNSIHPVDETTLRSFIDQVGSWADETVMAVGMISIKYDLNVEGNFIFETEIAKVPAGAERQKFKGSWLNDFILGTELRMLAWIYQQLFATPYLTPENREKV